MLKPKMIDLLYELMKNSKRSDRDLSKAIGVSQPTITRTRKILENSGYIREYTIMPDLEKLGFEIVALNFLSATTRQESFKEISDWISKNSKILFSSSGQSPNGKNFLIVSVHKNFTDFSSFIHELRESWGSNISLLESFLISPKTDVLKHFSFRNLERI